jgi:hypothetical protein
MLPFPFWFKPHNTSQFLCVLKHTCGVFSFEYRFYEIEFVVGSAAFKAVTQARLGVEIDLPPIIMAGGAFLYVELHTGTAVRLPIIESLAVQYIFNIQFI